MELINNLIVSYGHENYPRKEGYALRIDGGKLCATESFVYSVDSDGRPIYMIRNYNFSDLSDFLNHAIHVNWDDRGKAFTILEDSFGPGKERIPREHQDLVKRIALVYKALEGVAQNIKNTVYNPSRRNINIETVPRDYHT